MKHIKTYVLKDIFDNFPENSEYQHSFDFFLKSYVDDFENVSRSPLGHFWGFRTKEMHSDKDVKTIRELMKQEYDLLVRFGDEPTKIESEKSIIDIMHRTTDDATAKPVFLALEKEKIIPESILESTELKGSDEDISRFSVGFSYPVINLNDWIVEDVLEEDQKFWDYFNDAGYNYYIDDDCDSLVYWDRDQEITTTNVRRVFWTREEADAYCDHNPNMYSYSVVAGGVLAKLMDFTCEREIERVAAKREGRQSRL